MANTPTQNESWRPEGMQSVIPYLTMTGGEAKNVLTFLEQVFGGTVTEKKMRDNGHIWHAQVQIYGSTFMLGDAPDEREPMPLSLYVYVPDVDATYAAGLRAGAKSLGEPTDQPYGDRGAGLEDRWGNIWYLGTVIAAGQQH